MKVTLKLTHLADAERAMKKELIKAANTVIKNSISSLDDEIKLLTKQLMIKSSFFNNLLFGTLAGEFGIPKGEVSNVVESIIEEIANNIEVSYENLRLSGNNVRGGLKISIGRNGFSSLLSLAEASITTDKGDTLNWLDWVLTRGDQIIVSEHDILFSLGKGRSGLAVMIPSRIANWRVPAEFSGTADDNVITREIIRNTEIYSRLISRLVNKQIRSKLI